MYVYFARDDTLPKSEILSETIVLRLPATKTVASEPLANRQVWSAARVHARRVYVTPGRSVVGVNVTQRRKIRARLVEQQTLAKFIQFLSAAEVAYLFLA